MRKHNQAFGRALRQLRKRRNMTQEILGFEAGLDRTYISVLERGERSPTLDTLVSLCDVLGLSCGFHADSDTHSTHIRTVIPR
ncbi:helix-turn-helix domain-containing protein [Pseudomonas aeruginosa]